MIKYSIVALIAATAMLAGCSDAGSSQTGFAPRVAPAAVHASSRQMLYVSSILPSAGSVSVYPLGKSRPILQITDGINDPTHIAFDGAGNVYVGNENAVTVYAPGSTSPIRKLSIGLGTRGDLAFDSKGNLYVAYAFGQSSGVFEYKPGATHPERVIRSGITEPVSLAFDSSGKLYVANRGYPGSVEVYAPGKKLPQRTLQGKFITLTSITFDPSGNLYVADEGTYGHGAKVVVYAPGSAPCLPGPSRAVSAVPSASPSIRPETSTSRIFS